MAQENRAGFCSTRGSDSEKTACVLVNGLRVVIQQFFADSGRKMSCEDHQIEAKTTASTERRPNVL
jgi:hypothetical protein